MKVAIDAPAAVAAQRDRIAADVGDDAILDGDHFVARAISGLDLALGIAAFRRADTNILAEVYALLGAPGRRIIGRA